MNLNQKEDANISLASSFAFLIKLFQLSDQLYCGLIAVMPCVTISLASCAASTSSRLLIASNNA